MKKVGIITFHFADNFGAVLQAYALTKKIENYGINVEIINFTPQKLRSPYALFPNIRAMLSNKGISHTIRTVLGRIYNIKYYVTFPYITVKTDFIVGFLMAFCIKRLLIIAWTA